MKKMIALSVLMTSILSVAAFASDETYVAVACHDAREDLKDAGYSLTITQGGISGMTLATVMEQSIAGPRVLGTVAVTESNQGMQRNFNGDGFELSISLESLLSAETHPATMFFRQIIEGDIAVPHNAQMICTLSE